MPLALFIAYPLLVHLGVSMGLPLLQWLALHALFAGVLYRPLRKGNWRAWAGLAVFALVTGLLTRAGDGIYALYLPPLALTGLACIGFARSLRAGEIPMITRIAETVHGQLAPDLRAHTRTVTQIWALALAGMFLLILLLTLTGQRQWWSLFTNFISYGIMGAMFLLDYLYRRWRYPEHDREGFIAHIRDVVRNARSRSS